MEKIANIRVVDLFEAVMEHPHLHTLGGNYSEAIAYLEGCQDGFTHHHFDDGLESSGYALDLNRYRSFSSWLAEKYGLASGKEAFRRINEQSDNPSETVLGLYREFKAEVGNRNDL